MPVGVPHQVDGAFAHTSPIKNLNRILHDIDFHQRAGRNQIAHGVIFQADDGIAITSGIETFTERRRQCSQFLRIQSEQAGFMAVKAGVEVELEAKTGFARFESRGARPPGSAWPTNCLTSLASMPNTSKSSSSETLRQAARLNSL